MAPVGGNGSYIPRLDPDEVNSRKNSLARMQNVTPTPLSEIVNNPNRAYNKRSRVGGGGGNSGVGSSSGVEHNPDTSGVATDPYGKKSQTPDRDSITITSAKVRNAIEARRAGHTLPGDPSFTGLYPDHPTTSFTAGSQVWSHQKSALADARVEVTASGLYSLTGAVQPPAPTPTASSSGAGRRRVGSNLTLR